MSFTKNVKTEWKFHWQIKVWSRIAEPTITYAFPPPKSETCGYATVSLHDPLFDHFDSLYVCVDELHTARLTHIACLTGHLPLQDSRLGMLGWSHTALGILHSRSVANCLLQEKWKSGKVSFTLKSCTYQQWSRKPGDTDVYMKCILN